MKLCEKISSPNEIKWRKDDMAVPRAMVKIWAMVKITQDSSSRGLWT